jgi:hypothetical protein
LRATSKITKKKKLINIGTMANLIKMGKGARNQKDPFHQAYLDEKDRLRPPYLRCRTHVEKRRVQTKLLDWVYRNGGMFVQECPDNENVSEEFLEEFTDQTKLLEKCAQALREPRKKALSKADRAAKSVPSKDRPSLKKGEKIVLLKSDPQAKGSDQLTEGAPATKSVQALRELYHASKAVHPSPPVPPIEQDPMKDATTTSGVKKRTTLRLSNAIAILQAMVHLTLTLSMLRICSCWSMILATQVAHPWIIATCIL